MKAAGAAAMLMPLLASAAPAAAQQAAIAGESERAFFRPLLEEPIAPRDEGVSFRIAEQFEPDGSLSLRRGIIVGTEIVPDALVGIGLFEAMPKRVIRSEEERFDKIPKRTRKAAVGLRLSF